MEETGQHPEQSNPLADLIQDRMEEILVRWEVEVRKTPPARELSEPVLRDHLPQLLGRIAALIRSDEEAPDGAALEPFPESHALARLDAGFDLNTVAKEFGRLRRTILELWEEEQGQSIPVAQVRRLNQAIDAAVGVSVSRFAAARERTLQALDRISAAALGTGDLDTFLPRLIQVLQETTESVDAVMILLRDGEQLKVRSSVGLDLQGEGFALKVGESFAGKIATTREPDTLKVNEEHGPLKETAAISRNRLQVVYGVPLLLEGEVLGVAHMGSRTAPDFSPADKQLFRAMAQRATSLIAQAQLVAREQDTHQQAQRALAKLDALLAASPVGIAFLDRQLRYLRVNEAMAESNGRPAKEHLGRSLQEVIPELSPQLLPTLQQVLETGQPVTGMELVAPGEGPAERRRQFLGSYFPVRTPEGEILGVGAMVMEITERKRAQRELSRRAAEVETILESIPEAVYVGGMGGIHRANKVALEQLGFRSVEEMSANVATLAEQIQTRDAATGERLAPEDEPFAQAILRGEVTWREVKVRHLQTGEERVLRSKSAPIRQDGKVVGAVAINVDITDQARDAEALRINEERLRLAMDAAQAGMFDNDLRTGERRWDARARAMFGAAPGEVLTDERVRRPIPAEDQQRLDQALVAARDPAGDGELSIDYRLQEPDGGWRWVAVRGRCLFDREGRPVRLLGTILDITDRKRAEEELQRTANFREQFIGVLGHDLRNPLAAIMASAGMMLRKEDLPPGQLKGLRRISNSAERMARMISDVLDFARGRLGGGFPIERQRVNLHEICRRVVDELHVANPERELLFEAKGDGWGDWDPDRVAQAVSNLVGNALQHGASDAPVEVRLTDDPEGVRVEVKNQGRPIPPELLPVIFEPFRGAGDNPEHAGQKNLGLGLWIVQEIIHAHGGAVEVHSSQAEGTRFITHWPRQDPEPAALD